MFGALLGVFLGGCSGSGERSAEDLRAEGEMVFAPFPEHGSEPSEGDWVIVLGVVSGSDSAVLPALARVRSAGLADARIQQRSERGAAIVYGKYDGPGDKRAQADLLRVRGVAVGGERPFARAFLAPPSSGAEGSIPEFDLRNVKATYGKDALYTLQIGGYGRGDNRRPSSEELADFREQAEEAVKQLRREGEQAFFYHGPNMSNITVGVFGPDDHDQNNPLADSFELAELRKRFPNNLLNGQGLNQTMKTTSGEQKMLQRSQLVAIP